MDFQPGLGGTIALATLSVSKDVTIVGPGAAALTVSGGRSTTVFSIRAASTVTIAGLTVADGE